MGRTLESCPKEAQDDSDLSVKAAGGRVSDSGLLTEGGSPTERNGRRRWDSLTLEAGRRTTLAGPSLSTLSGMLFIPQTKNMAFF